MAAQLVVYARAYCHLCDDLITALRSLQGRFDFVIRVVDVDADEVLAARYDERVPVLAAEECGNERELCNYFLDEPVVTAYLSEMR